MKKRFFILFLITSFFFSGCGNEEKIFKGEVSIVETPSTDMLNGEKVVLNGLYAGYPIIFDSIICFLYRYDNYFISKFDINTGKHLGIFFHRGQGTEEFLNFMPLHPESNCEFWIHEYQKRHFVLVDMSSGAEKKRINFSNFKKKGGFPFARVFILDDSLLIAVNQPETKNLNDDIMVPKLRLINYLTKEEITDYELYDEDLYNRQRGIGMDNEHLVEAYHIKPDKSKVAAIMNRLFQINILDLKTGEWKGFRVAGTHGFKFVRTPLPPTDSSYYSYYNVSVDDEFIYAILNNYHEPDVKPVIHVFDWNGNFVRILECDQKGVVFNLDNVRKKLYFKDNEEGENVWVYDVSYLYIG